MVIDVTIDIRFSLFLKNCLEDAFGRVGIKMAGLNGLAAAIVKHVGCCKVSTCGRIEVIHLFAFYSSITAVV